MRKLSHNALATLVDPEINRAEKALYRVQQCNVYRETENTGSSHAGYVAGNCAPGRII